jgi:succinate dehydrogenase/fumarate reductase flavoprotein subunit
MEVEIGEIGGGGALLIDEKCESTVSGLYAPGVGLMLSGVLCGGLVAGQEAGKAARHQKTLPEIDAGQLAVEKEKTFSPLGRGTGYTPSEFEDMIRQLMNYYLGYIRTQAGLEIALKKLEKIEEHIDEINASNNHELMRANEARHLLKFCQLTVRAVMETNSNRGFYIRSDQPDSVAEVATQVALWEEEGKPRVSFIPTDKGG